MIVPPDICNNEMQPPVKFSDPENLIEPSGFVTPCTRFPFTDAEVPKTAEVTLPDQVPVIVGGGGGVDGVVLPPHPAKNVQHRSSAKSFFILT